MYGDPKALRSPFKIAGVIWDKSRATLQNTVWDLNNFWINTDRFSRHFRFLEVYIKFFFFLLKNSNSDASSIQRRSSVVVSWIISLVCEPPASGSLVTPLSPTLQMRVDRSNSENWGPVPCQSSK